MSDQTMNLACPLSDSNASTATLLPTSDTAKDPPDGSSVLAVVPKSELTAMLAPATNTDSPSTAEEMLVPAAAGDTNTPAPSLAEVADQAFEILDKFTLFPKLPKEIRLLIWEAAIVPRFIRRAPGGGMPPGYIYACAESRAATSGAYDQIVLLYMNHIKYKLFINYDMDVLCITNFHAAFHAQSHDISSSLVQSFKRLAIELYHAAECSQYSLSLSLKPNDLNEPHSTGFNFWRKVNSLFPSMEELVIVGNLSLEHGIHLDELSEVTLKDFKDIPTQNPVQQSQNEMARIVSHNFKLSRQSAIRTGAFKITFMRLSVEHERKICGICNRPIHSDVFVRPHFGDTRVCYGCLLRSNYQGWIKEGQQQEQYFAHRYRVYPQLP